MTHNVPVPSAPAPVISVVICTYNRLRLLPRAVRSLLQQTIPNWEAIIIDDGSTDNTSEYASTLIELDPRFKYFRQPQSGLTIARNAGLTRATSRWVTFLDSDDEYDAEHLELRLNALAEHPETDLLYGGVKVVGGPDFVPDLHDPSRSIPLSECYIGGTFVLRRTTALEMGGFHRPDYGNDHDLAQRALQNRNVRRVNYPTYIYHRDAPDSMCNLMEKSCQSNKNH